MGHFQITLWLNSFSLSVSEKRFNKQYSKEYKAKEVSEGEESKDFWNVLGGKANFTSLSGGLYLWTIGCTLIILNKFYARVIQGLYESENSQEKLYFSKSLKSQGICYFWYIKIQLNSETQRTQTAEMNKHGYSVFFVCVFTPKRKFNISKKVYWILSQGKLKS